MDSDIQKQAIKSKVMAKIQKSPYYGKNRTRVVLQAYNSVLFETLLLHLDLGVVFTIE